MDSPVNVWLVTAEQCPHCPSLKRIFSELDEAGKIAKLEITDINDLDASPGVSQIRSVPWFRIGNFEFTGAYRKHEIEFWLEHANDETGIARYVTEKLDSGQLSDIELLVQRHPDWLPVALTIMADPESPIQARIGLSALLESNADKLQLDNLLPVLRDYAHHRDHRVRGDACHILGFINSPESVSILRRCLDDQNADVREIASESLTGLIGQ